MPHQCVRCHNLYEDGSEEILKGCSCGAKLFFYVKKSAIAKANQIAEDLTHDEKDKIEQDVLGIMGIDEIGDVPVVLDFESINVIGQGKFELDLVNLFKKDPLIYRLSDGKYFIDLFETFKSAKQNRKENLKEIKQVRKERKKSSPSSDPKETINETLAEFGDSSDSPFK